MYTATFSYAQDTHNTKTNVADAIVRKEITQKILLFAGILSCLALAVNI